MLKKELVVKEKKRSWGTAAGLNCSLKKGRKANTKQAARNRYESLRIHGENKTAISSRVYAPSSVIKLRRAPSSVAQRPIDISGAYSNLL